jgi:hypothetical protein
VKNKIELQVVRVPPRGAKAIAEAVTIYRVVLEAGTLQPTPPVPVYQPPTPAPVTSGHSQRSAGPMILTGLIVAAAIGLIWRWQQTQGDELARSRAAQAQLDALLTAKDREQPAAPASGSGAGEAAPETEFRQLLAWVNGALPRYTKDRPLRLRELPGAFSRDSKLFTEPDGRVYFAEGGAVRARELASLKPEALGSVVVSTLLDAPQPPPRELFAAAESYARTHGLTEMAAALGDRARR